MSFINRMYETLTQRTVQKVARRPLPDKVPPFARDTGAAAIRNSMRGSKLAETNDEISRQVQLEERVGQHERSLQAEKSIDPDRYSRSSKHSSTSIARGPPRAIGPQVPAVPQVTVKEIQVRQVDRSIAQLRAGGISPPHGPEANYAASHDIPLVDGAAKSVNNPSWQQHFNRESAPVDAEETISEYIPVRDLDELLCECIEDGGYSFPSVRDAPSEMVCAFVNSALSDEPGCIPSATAVSVYEQLKNSAASVALATLASGSETFRRVSELFTIVMLKTSAAQDVFDAAALAFGAIGREMQKRDTRMSTAAFIEVSLPALLPVLHIEGMDAKRRAVLKLLCDFVATNSEAHLSLVADLQKLIKDKSVFVFCVATLAQLVCAYLSTRRFRPSKQLVDLYLYYTSVCLAQATASLRVAGVATLAAAAPLHSGILAPYLPTLVAIAQQDKWWETQAQLVVVSAVGLVPDSTYYASAEMRDNLLCIIHECFHTAAPARVRTVGLVALAPIITRPEMDSSLQKAFVDVLLSLEESEMLCLLGTSHDGLQLSQIAGARCMPNLAASPRPLQEMAGREALHGIFVRFASESPRSSAVMKILEAIEMHR